jgi:hypothetical protein
MQSAGRAQSRKRLRLAFVELPQESFEFLAIHPVRQAAGFVERSRVIGEDELKSYAIFAPTDSPGMH